MKSDKLNALAFCLGLIVITPHALAEEPPAGEKGAVEKIQTISKGEPFKVKSHLQAGKYTIFEFFDDNWTSAGLEVSAQIEAKVRAADDMVLRRIEIPSWQAPAVRQYRLTGLPHYKFYDPSGRLMKEFSPKDVSRPPLQPASKRASPGATLSGGPKVQTISSGQRVEIGSHLAKGRFTVVEFYADW